MIDVPMRRYSTGIAFEARDAVFFDVNLAYILSPEGANALRDSWRQQLWIANELLPNQKVQVRLSVGHDSPARSSGLTDLHAPSGPGTRPFTPNPSMSGITLRSASP